jgi:nondiscriminating glutamyl-tRNA synthetase
MTVRVRFAPSPTGKVHIGNIRAAIFNWLFARHERGCFLLRIEDTDLERSTPEAIEALLEVMQWLGIDYDEAALYQTSQKGKHTEAAVRLLAQGDAYKDAKGGGGEAVIFRYPYDAEKVPGVSTVGPAEIAVSPDHPVLVDKSGIRYSTITKNGKVAEDGCSLAGMKGLEIFGALGQALFRLDDQIAGILAGEQAFEIPGATCLKFIRRQIAYRDVVKGELGKPLDSMKDFVIVRSDGSPVFHLGNVVDDITQAVTHIIRGDDHVENTYKHIFLFAALGATPPTYGHLPMIINAQGKPYSKRDGDAFVGDFRDKGYLPEALFNYLTLLGWSPGDDREKMNRQELIAAFTLDRVKSGPAQMDLRKLENLNGMYIAEFPFEVFLAAARGFAAKQEWFAAVAPEQFENVARMMHTRTHTFAAVAGWKYFFTTPDYDEKATEKALRKQPRQIHDALLRFADQAAGIDWTPEAIETLTKTVATETGAAPNKLNPAIRIAITGTNAGACLYQTAVLIGRETIQQRLRDAVTAFPPME